MRAVGGPKGDALQICHRRGGAGGGSGQRVDWLTAQRLRSLRPEFSRAVLCCAVPPDLRRVTHPRRARRRRRGTRPATANLSPLVGAMRGAVLALVVAGYVLLASASAAGHGWWLIQHSATAHHAADPDAPATEPHGHGDAHDDADDHDGHDGHGHDLIGDHHIGAHHADGDDHADDHDEVDAAAVHGAHTHSGHVHTHDGQTQPPPAVLVGGIGKHCLPASPVLPVPPVMRGERGAGEVLVPVDAVHAVEAPPPRRGA